MNELTNSDSCVLEQGFWGVGPVENVDKRVGMNVWMNIRTGMNEYKDEYKDELTHA